MVELTIEYGDEEMRIISECRPGSSLCQYAEDEEWQPCSEDDCRWLRGGECRCRAALLEAYQEVSKRLGGRMRRIREALDAEEAGEE